MALRGCARLAPGLLALALLAGQARAAEIGCAYGSPPADAERFSELVESRAAALAQALRAEDQAERAMLADLLPAERSRVQAGNLAGDWRCRLIKVGGLLPLVAYTPFQCRISEDGDSLAIDKLTGSQRFTGRLTPSGGGFAYVGALHVAGEPSRAYGGDRERDEVGCLTALGPDRLLLELPRPRLESRHNLIELVRGR